MKGFKKKGKPIYNKWIGMNKAIMGWLLRVGGGCNGYGRTYVCFPNGPTGHLPYIHHIIHTLKQYNAPKNTEIPTFPMSNKSFIGIFHRNGYMLLPWLP